MIWVLLVLLGLAAIADVILIGQPRQPKTHLEAIGDLIFLGALAAILWTYR